MQPHPALLSPLLYVLSVCFSSFIRVFFIYLLIFLSFLDIPFSLFVSLFRHIFRCLILEAGRPMFSSRQGQKNIIFSQLHLVQADSGSHPASYPTGTGGSLLGVKRPWREGDHVYLMPRLRMRDVIPTLSNTSS